MGKSISEEIERTRSSVSQITCWCLTVALHQEFGMGKARLERLAEVLDGLQESNYRLMIDKGPEAADKERQNWLKGLCDDTFRVPLLRAARNNRERQLKMAGDEAATTSWQLYGKACVDTFGFGASRLKRLKEAGWKNYEQFNGWAAEDGEDVAMDKLRRCAQDALREEMQVVDDDNKAAKETDKELRNDLRRSREFKMRHSKAGKPGYAILSSTKIEQIAAEARAATAGWEVNRNGPKNTTR